MTATCPVCASALPESASACPTCGFKLLGSTQSFKPYSPEEGIDAPHTKPTGAALNVVRGPQIGMEFKLGDKSLSIGRSPQCDIFLNDMTVSRLHATVEPVGAGYVISDENSFNGVWVNNDSIETRELKVGDIIQIGAFCLVYREE